MPTTVWARHKKRYTCTAFSPFEQAQARFGVGFESCRAYEAPSANDDHSK
jgi:hypothetical protein